jgi:hypothetical protein
LHGRPREGRKNRVRLRPGSGGGYGEVPVSEDPRELPEPSDSNDDRGQPPSAAETERGDSPVNDQLDVTVHDTEVLAEIEMMTNLIIATSESDGPLPQVKIDEILGVDDDMPPV